MNGKLKLEQQIVELTQESLRRLQQAGTLPAGELPAVQAEVPKDERFGDISVNTAMQLAKKAGMNPRELAQRIIDNLELEGTYVVKTDIAGPGFTNFTLSPQWLWDELSQILREQGEYGKITLTEPKSINVEYVSANPTGPLHIGNARGGAIGDVMANIYKWAGWNSVKEFYLNDAGNQIIKFGESLSARYMQLFEPDYPFPADGYQGEDVKALAQRYREENGDALRDADKQSREETLVDYALAINVGNMKRDLMAYGIHYDKWFSELTLHQSGAINDIIKVMSDRGATYEKDGALWFKATDYNCEKDEVLIRQNGVPTYYAADIAYHYDKLVVRGFDLAVDVWGADHHGHVHRVQMALAAAGIDPKRLKVILMQLVHLVEGEETIRMSKRKGQIVTLSDLIGEVGTDAARFIFNSYNPSTHMDFDLSLAIRQSNENPVFYVQYAYARMKSILRNVSSSVKNANLTLLQDKAELALLKKMADFSKEIAYAARDFDPSRMTKYALDLAAHLHSFYNACRVKCDDEALTAARLALVEGCAYVMKNTLNILGVSAPEQM